MEKKKFFSGKRRIYIIAVVVTVLLLGIFIYFKYFLNFSGVSTEVVTRSTKEVVVPINFFVVRDEEYLDSKASTRAIPLVSDGTRVAENDKIAVVCGSETDASNYSEILQLEEDIAYYTQLNSLTNINNINLDSANQQICSAFADLLNIADSGKLSDFDRSVRAFSDKKTRRDIAINGRMDFSQRISQLTERLTSLKSSLSNVQEIRAEQSGFYMKNTDGFEKTLKYEDVLKLTPADVENAINAQAQEPKANLGRLIKSHKWYLCAVVDKKTATELVIGGNYKLILPELGLDRQNFRLEAVNQSEDDKYALIFSGLESGDSIFNLRKGEAQLIKKTYTGYKIPQAAIRTEQNKEGKDEKFVYILNKTTVKRKDIKIIYSDRDYVLIEISTDKLDNKVIQLYDKVITAGKDLRDGKIIY